MTESAHVNILVVDDNVLDARATIRAMAMLEREIVPHHLADGAAALAFLMEPGVDNPRPDLVLLDLNLPGIHGLDVLRWMSSDPEISDVPVAILTTSDHQTDISRASTFGADAYFTKPFDLDGWAPILPRLEKLIDS